MKQRFFGSNGDGHFDWWDIACAVAFIVYAIGLFVAPRCHCAEPPRKPTLYVALDDGPRSQMLHSELTRNWTVPNPSVRLTASQERDLLKRGSELNRIGARLGSYFRIEFVSADAVPLSVRFKLPAIRINRGAWEVLDKRAFAYEGRPLVTLEWYRRQHYAISKDPPKGPDMTYWQFCATEGYSGGDPSDFPPPWECKEPFPSYEGCQ